MQKELTLRMKQNSKEQVQKAPSKSGKDAINFLSDVKLELKRITWTSKDEMRLYLKVVVLSTFLLGIGIYGVDIIIQMVLKSLNLILKFIGG